MSSRRFTGKTESDAVMNAAMELGIPSTDLDYEVIDPGSNGFFGLFRKPAIIEIKEKVKEPVAEKQEKPAPQSRKSKRKKKKRSGKRSRRKRIILRIRNRLQNRKTLLFKKKRKRVRFRKILMRLPGVQKNIWMKF